MDTVWVFGDQLNLQIGALATARPGSARVLMIESASKLTAAPWHVQRAHFLVTSMRRFASEVAASGFEVDYRQTATFAEGLAGHRGPQEPLVGLSLLVRLAPGPGQGRDAREQGQAPIAIVTMSRHPFPGLARSEPVASTDVPGIHLGRGPKEGPRRIHDPR